MGVHLSLDTSNVEVDDIWALCSFVAFTNSRCLGEGEGERGGLSEGRPVGVRFK